MRVGTWERTIAVVGRDSEDSLVGLAPVYALVLSLRDAGLSDEAIAITLGVTVEAVPTLVDVAVRKRARQARQGGADAPSAATRATNPEHPPREEATCEGR